VHQILINLLDNAMKYTPDGGVITLGTRPGEPGEVEIFVKDSGVGIPAEDVPRLFERFYRVDKARSRELGGYRTGLGDRQTPGACPERRGSRGKLAK